MDSIKQIWVEKTQKWEPCLGQTSMVSMTKQWNRENRDYEYC